MSTAAVIDGLFLLKLWINCIVFAQAQNKDEIKEYLDSLMAQEGAIGYVLINYDGK